MTDKAKAIPDGFHTITPHLTVRDANRALEYHVCARPKVSRMAATKLP